MKVFTCEQGSQEWHDLRRGVPTASEFQRILPPKTRKPGAGARSYLEELIGDKMSIYYRENAESFTNKAVRWGEQCEAEARKWYALERNVDVELVGFCTTDDGRFGCSPDGLVGEDGGLELKCPQANTHVGYLLDGVLPTDYMGQVHGSLIVTGRKWWDFLSYAPGLPPLLVRVTPDEYTEALRKQLDKFWDELQAATELVGSR